MKTRRKSKVAAAATAPTEPEQDAGSSQTTDADVVPHSTLDFAIPADIDIETLSNLLPGTSLTSATPDAIISLYRVLVAQVSQFDAAQRDLDEARAEAERKDVEFDQALQDRESLSKDLEASLETAHNEVSQLKQERDEIAASQAALQAQIASLSTSQSSSSTELEQLKRRVEDTEREKRDLIGVISRLKHESSQREEEIQTLRVNLKEARQDHQTLEAQVRELRSIETSTKFKFDSLTQQLQLSQVEVERTTSELTMKSEEFAKYRRSKHAELTQLQASHDTIVQTFASTESTLKALQSAHTAQTHHYTQALARVQDLTGQLAEQEATYSSEASGLRRLVAMMEEREKQAKEIVEGIEREWAGVGDKAERREIALKEEIEHEKQAREQAEKRIEQLETVLNRIDSGELPLPGRAGSGSPATPARRSGTPDLLTQGMMGLSPTVAMASRAQRGGKTFTEVYGDYIRLQDEFAKKSAECDHMDRTLSAVLAQIEERAPILSQQRVEYERLQSEAAQLAAQLAQALSDRDLQVNLVEENSQKLKKSAHESELLQKQLDDLGRQVQALLKELGRRDDPMIPYDEDLDQMSALEPAENIEAVITNNLVLFRSIGGLQEQNQKLLRIVRELGAKMEAEEKDYKEMMDKEQGEAVKEAHEAIQELAAQLERQKKGSEMTIQAYMKERDALRSMLNRAERAASGSGVPKGSMPNGDVNGFHEEAGSDLAKELAEIQDQFETYRTEMGVDSVRLREEVVLAQREAGQLGAALAKANAKIEYLNDRHRMLQEELLIQGRELDHLRKRNQQLDDQFMRADIACHHASEDLAEARSQVEQLRNDCANLRAEKRIWESVQSRLADENKTLALERSHLSDLMGNVQKMHNDLERSGENDRRRLESQMQMLEQQTQDLKAQLSQERDAVRHVSLQKEIELKEIQTRLERSSQEFAKTRESLVGAETSKRHLEERVDDLTRQLQGKQEKLAVYERRPTTGGVSQQVDMDLTHEQQLEAEVAELRSALKVAEMDLVNARSHVQQFQEISQANESALATLHATHDEYQTKTEAQIARHESDCNALQEQLQSAQEEFSQLRTQYNELQRNFENERTVWLNDKKTLEDTIVDMSTSEKHLETDRTLRESTSRELEERVKAAEERYAHEVVVHAESIKAVENLKQQLSTAQSAMRDHLASAETAKVNLATSESSWKQQKETLVKEVADLNARCKDLASHNNLLHQHLEDVSSQAARIRQAADASLSAQPGEGETDENWATKLSELRSVVAYLRKEKEIVDLQLELSKQENTRLKSQMDHLSQNMQELRTTLAEERERAVEGAASTAQHDELIERINQLNILRESNATLRSDCETHAKRARDLEAKLQLLSSELEPAKEQGRIAHAELEARDAQLKRLEEESRRWQERNTQLLTKFDRIDPAEVQALKDQIEELKLQKEKSVVEQEAMIASQTQRIEALEASVRNHKESHAKNMQGFKSRLGQLNAEKSKLNADLTESQNQIKALTMERDTLKSATPADSSQELAQQVETLRREKSTIEKAFAEEKAAKVQEQNPEQASIIVSLREERDRLLAEKESWGNGSGLVANSVMEEAKRLWESEKAELVKAHDEAATQAQAATEQARKALEEAKNIRFSNEKFQSKIQDLQRARAADAGRAAAQQEASVKAAVDTLKTEMSASNAPSTSGNAVEQHAEEMRALEHRLTAKHQEELKAAVDAALATGQKEKPAGPSNSGDDQKAAIATAIAEHEKQLQVRHAEEIASAVERGRMEQATKGKLKDSQLVKSQKRVKELETQIFEWRKAGIIPEPSAPTPVTPVTSTPTATSPQISTPVVPPAVSLAVAGNLPRKPSVMVPAALAEGAGRGGRGGARGVVRGAQRGGLNIRGAAPGRGGAPGGSVPNTASGVSIIGAAAKRTREDGETQDDSLAKRLKPAEGGGPVTLRRPPPS